MCTMIYKPRNHSDTMRLGLREQSLFPNVTREVSFILAGLYYGPYTEIGRNRMPRASTWHPRLSCLHPLMSGIEDAIDSCGTGLFVRQHTRIELTHPD
jgi:hypothetical protein